MDSPPDYMLTGHKCLRIARMPMREGRDWWMGELTERLPDHPHETHCLHIQTPLKSVVLGVYRADLDYLAVLAQMVGGGPLNPHWSEKMADLMRRLADDTAFADYRRRVGGGTDG